MEVENGDGTLPDCIAIEWCYMPVTKKKYATTQVDVPHLYLSFSLSYVLFHLLNCYHHHPPTHPPT